MIIYSNSVLPFQTKPISVYLVKVWMNRWKVVYFLARMRVNLIFQKSKKCKLVRQKYEKNVQFWEVSLIASKLALILIFFSIGAFPKRPVRRKKHCFLFQPFEATVQKHLHPFFIALIWIWRILGFQFHEKKQFCYKKQTKFFREIEICI